MKQCTNCNRILEDSNNFCTSCGAKLVSLESESIAKGVTNESMQNHTSKNPQREDATDKSNISQTVEHKKQDKVKKKRGIKIVVAVAVLAVLVLGIGIVYFVNRSWKEQEQVVYLQDGNLVYTSIKKEPKVIKANYSKELLSEVITSFYESEGYSDSQELIEELVLTSTVHMSGEYLFYLEDYDWGERSNTVQADLMYINLEKHSKKAKKVAHISFGYPALFGYDYYDTTSYQIDFEVVPYVVTEDDQGIHLIYSTDETTYSNDLDHEKELCEGISELLWSKSQKTLIGVNDEEKITIIDGKTFQVTGTLEASDYDYATLKGNPITLWYRSESELGYIKDGKKCVSDIPSDEVYDYRFMGDGTCYYLMLTSKTLSIRDFLKDSAADSDLLMEEPSEDDFKATQLDEDLFQEYSTYYDGLLAEMQENYDYYVQDALEYGYENYYADFNAYLDENLYYLDDYYYLSNYYYYSMSEEEGLSGFEAYLKEQLTSVEYDWDAYYEAWDLYNEKLDRDSLRQEIADGYYDVTLDMYDLYYYDGTKSEVILNNVVAFQDPDLEFNQSNHSSTVVISYDLAAIDELKGNQRDIKELVSWELSDFQNEIKASVTENLTYIREKEVQVLESSYNRDYDASMVTADHQYVFLMKNQYTEEEPVSFHIYDLINGESTEVEATDFIWDDYSGIYWIEKSDATYDLYDGINCVLEDQYDKSLVEAYELAQGTKAYVFYDYNSEQKNLMIINTTTQDVIYEIENVDKVNVFPDGTMYYTKMNGTSGAGRVDLYYYFDVDTKEKLDMNVSSFIVDEAAK